MCVLLDLRAAVYRIRGSRVLPSDNCGGNCWKLALCSRQDVPVSRSVPCSLIHSVRVSITPVLSGTNVSPWPVNTSKAIKGPSSQSRGPDYITPCNLTSSIDLDYSCRW